MSESKTLKEKRDNRVKKIAIITMVVLLMAAIGTVIVNSISYYTVRINYLFSDGSPAHDPYIATFSVGEPLDYDVTNPNVSGFDPMMLTDEGNDPAALPTGGVSAPTTHSKTNELNGDITYNVYYIAGLTHYAARYYLQNVYDDLYTPTPIRTVWAKREPLLPIWRRKRSMALQVFSTSPTLSLPTVRQCSGSTTTVTTIP